MASVPKYNIEVRLTVTYRNSQKIAMIKATVSLYLVFKNCGIVKAYDAWPADPIRDARHELWPAGDCYLVYPGGTSCVRFEKIREGIVDFEKIRMVKEKAAKSSDKNVKYLVQQLDIHLETLLSEKEFDTKKIIVDVMKGRKIIEQLSEKLK